MKRKKRQKASNTPALDAQAQALERFKALLPASEYEKLLAALAIPLRPALRINPLKVEFTPGEFPAHIQKRYGWQTEAIPFCNTGWWLEDSADTPPGKTLEHRLGHYYIQDAASMLPVELFDFASAPPDALILDMASSPGGKTTHLIARSGDRGLVLANDSSRERITALKLVLQTWGGLNWAITQFPGEKFGGWYPETFDRVLLDAPCSMESLHSTDSHPMRPITERERGQLAKRQSRLLESALQAVKCGGEVVYSTCTLAPEEDEAVLEHVLKTFADAIEIVAVERLLPAPAPAMQQVQGQQFSPQVRNAVRLYPHICGTSGFFAALIRKKASVKGRNLPPPAQPFERTGLQALSATEERSLYTAMQDDFGFDLARTLEEQNLTLWRRAGSILAFPRRYLERFPGLACRAGGLPLMEENPSGNIISHEWASRFIHHFNRGFYPLPDELAAAFSRGEDIAPDTIPQSESAAAAILVTDSEGRLLGRARLQSNRLKNLLPRRLVS